MATFSNTEAQVTLAEIEDAERYAGLTFPNQYKEHLLQYNGGQCFPNIFMFIEGQKQAESCIDWFLAIYDGEYDNLKEYIRIYKLEDKRLPSQILPIAHDPGGNLICISCKGEDIGCIYFWDHENEVDYRFSDDKNYSNLYLINRTFNLFINGLKEDVG